MKKYRVIQYGAGATGKFALRAILTHPMLELTGLGVHSERSEGRDAGSICRMPDTGVLATRDLSALLAQEADCVAFLPWDPYAGDVMQEDTQSGRMFSLLCQFLATGKNVVASAPNSLVYPPSLAPEAVAKLEEACRRGNSSFLYTGVSPGFMPDRLVLALTQISARIDSIAVREIMNYADYSDYDTIVGFFGFGREPESVDLETVMDSFSRGLGGSVAMIADAVKVKLDNIQMNIQFERADRDEQMRTGSLAKGTIGALRITASGMVQGKPRIVAEHVTRVSDFAAPEWPQFGQGGMEGYQIEIHGAPAMMVEVELGAFGRNPMADAGWAVAGNLTNSIVSVCESAPGIQTFMDLPLTVGAYRMSA